MMNRTIELLNEVLKSYKGVAIAEMFSLGNGAVSTWKKRQHVSPYYAAKLAELIGEDPQRAMAIAGAEGEPDDEKRSYLLKMLWQSEEELTLARLREENNGGPPVSRTRHQRIMSPLL
jgi:hypothetical protein